jgi:hypothetical protein
VELYYHVSIRYHVEARIWSQVAEGYSCNKGLRDLQHGYTRHEREETHLMCFTARKERLKRTRNKVYEMFLDAMSVHYHAPNCVRLCAHARRLECLHTETHCWLQASVERSQRDRHHRNRRSQQHCSHKKCCRAERKDCKTQLLSVQSRS